jgi:glycosyltransferase involved in cell wall biosynthesis
MHVLLIGDGIRASTGFAQVLREVNKELQSRLHTVAQLTAMDMVPVVDASYYFQQGVKPYFTHEFDGIGIQMLDEVIKDFKPDVIFINYDPGTVWNYYQGPLKECEIPIVVYAPVEGAPILPSYAEAFSKPTRAYTYTKWSSEQLRREHRLEIPWVYHGVDTKLWKPLDHWERTKLRRQLGWDDRFVITYVGRNVSRKCHDRLLKAVAILKRQFHMDDVLLYLHTKAFDGFTMQGWDLDGLALWCGVSAEVEFSSQKDTYHAEESYSLRQKLAASDLYVHAASVEGFGLPIIEALASGVPTITVEDEGNISEVGGTGVMGRIRPIDWETWFNGAQLAMMHPQHIAEAIAQSREKLRDKQFRSVVIDEGLAWAKRFNWQTMAETLVNAMEACISEKVLV